ncbi:MAG TPA: N-acetyl-anhydromuranmyl-L-alanine amidase [Gammaproteobacteria bacterium]|nr:N-acetyl-anhydromuranmyl-L-alanine amidase [Gammaproteobacteria bacterium]
MIEKLLFEGDIFGIVDNGILAVVTIFGIDLEKKFFGGSGVIGGLFGALIGNAISDLLAAVIDPAARHLAIGVFAGCMYVTVIVFLYLRISKKEF